MVSKIIRADGTTELASVKSVTYHESVNADIDLRPGCVASSYIEVTCFGQQTDAPTVGEALTYYQVVGDTETLIGIFYAEPSIPTKNSYSFIAYDAVHKLDADFSAWLSANQANFPYTVYQLVSQACSIAGVTLGSSSWSNSTMSVNAFYADGITCRNILQYAAEIGCKFVRCHTNGNVYFEWYTTASNKRIYPSSGTSGSETRYAYKQDGLTYDNYDTSAVARVAVHPVGEDDVAYYYPANVQSGNTLNITNNAFLYGASPANMTTIAQTIYNALTSLGVYRPMSVEMFPNECPLSAGEKVAVTDAQNVSFTTLVMEKTVTDSAVTLISTGREVYGDYALDTAKQLVQLASDIVRINKLKVGWAEIDTAVVGVLTSEGIMAEIDGANKEEQLIYKTVASGTSSVSPTTTWITNTADQPNTWTKKRPSYDANYPVLFVATQRKAVDGTITCTTPLKDDNSTTISGGQITTGTIDASRVTVTNINADNITTGALTVRDASNNIIFQADKDTKTVQMGGWVANATELQSTDTSSTVLHFGQGELYFKNTLSYVNDKIGLYTSPYEQSQTHYKGLYLYMLLNGENKANYISGFAVNAMVSGTQKSLFSVSSATGGDAVAVSAPLYVNDSFTHRGSSVSITDASAWRTAIGAVNKAGDTMTGSLTLSANATLSYNTRHTGVTAGTAPSATTNVGYFIFNDSATRALGYLTSVYTTAKDSFIKIAARNWIGSTAYDNGFELHVDASGTSSVAFSSPAAWLTGLGLGTPTTTSTASQIISLSSGWTASLAQFATWGKIGMLRMNVSRSTAQSSAAEVTVGTLVAGKRPVINTGGTRPNDPNKTVYITSAGVVSVYGSFAANATIAIVATFILA